MAVVLFLPCWDQGEASMTPLLGYTTTHAGCHIDLFRWRVPACPVHPVLHCCLSTFQLTHGEWVLWLLSSVSCAWAAPDVAMHGRHLTRSKA
jgi:hypothetical protein